MRTRIVRIGNSQGVRLPGPLLEQAGVGEDVVIRPTLGRIVIEDARAPRAGWVYAAKAMHSQGEDVLLDAESAVIRHLKFLSLYNSQRPGILATIGTQDFDANRYMARFDDGGQHGPNANCGLFPRQSTTNVRRTAGRVVVERRPRRRDAAPQCHALSQQVAELDGSGARGRHWQDVDTRNRTTPLSPMRITRRQSAGCSRTQRPS